MKLALFLLPAVAALTLSAAGIGPSGLSTSSRNDRVIVDRLPGTWMLDQALTLRAQPDRELLAMRKLTFTPDPKVLDLLRPLAPAFAKHELLQSGWMWINGEGAYPYLVSNFRGLTHLDWFVPVGHGKLAVAGALKLELMPQRDEMGDLLFLGRETTRAWGVVYDRTD